MTTQQQTPAQILADVQRIAPQLQQVQVPNAEPIPANLSGGDGLSAIFTPQFADNLSLSAITGHPGQNGLSAVLQSVVGAHQQRSATNGTRTKARVARRKSLLLQKNQEVAQAQKTLEVKQKAAASLLRSTNATKRTKAFQNQVNATTASTKTRERIANAKLESKVTVARANAGVKADERQAKATQLRHSQHLKSLTTQVTNAQKTSQGLRVDLQKASKTTLDLNGQPAPMPPAQQASVKMLYHRMVASENAVAVANAKVAVTNYLLATGSDPLSATRLATLQTAIWSADAQGFAQETVTILEASPSSVTFAITDGVTGNVRPMQATLSSPNGAAVMRRLQDIPSLGLSFSLPQVAPPPVAPAIAPPLVGGANLPLPPNTGANLLRQ